MPEELRRRSLWVLLAFGVWFTVGWLALHGVIWWATGAWNLTRQALMGGATLR